MGPPGRGAARPDLRRNVGSHHRIRARDRSRHVVLLPLPTAPLMLLVLFLLCALPSCSCTLLFLVNHCNVPRVASTVHCEFCHGVVALASGWVWSCRRRTFRQQTKHNGCFSWTVLIPNSPIPHTNICNLSENFLPLVDVVGAITRKTLPRAHTRAHIHPQSCVGMRTHRHDLRTASYLIVPRSSHGPHKNKIQPQLTCERRFKESCPESTGAWALGSGRCWEGSCTQASVLLGVSPSAPLCPRCPCCCWSCPRRNGGSAAPTRATGDRGQKVCHLVAGDGAGAAAAAVVAMMGALRTSSLRRSVNEHDGVSLVIHRAIFRHSGARFVL